MDKITLLNLVVNIIGIPCVVGSFIYIGRKLQIVDDLKDAFHKMKDSMNHLSERVSYVEGRHDAGMKRAKDSR